MEKAGRSAGRELGAVDVAVPGEAPLNFGY